MSTEFKKGDRVKVTLEGTVSGVCPFGDDRIELRIEVGNDTYYVSPNAANVEKVEPEVEVFGPGDVVRGLFTGNVYTLGHGGALLHRTGTWREESDPYTSELFERVQVG